MITIFHGVNIKELNGYGFKSYVMLVCQRVDLYAVLNGVSCGYNGNILWMEWQWLVATNFSYSNRIFRLIHFFTIQTKQLHSSSIPVVRNSRNRQNQTYVQDEFQEITNLFSWKLPLEVTVRYGFARKYTVIGEHQTRMKSGSHWDWDLYHP